MSTMEIKQMSTMEIKKESMVREMDAAIFLWRFEHDKLYMCDIQTSVSTLIYGAINKIVLFQCTKQ